tara:strand:+ start:108 stop:335 length:228 start_codon:yes stop_codon:yes gene_type:complete
MRKLTKLQIDELQSFGYMVRSNEDIEKMEESLKQNAKDNKPTSVKANDIKATVEEESIDTSESEEDFSYLDELET